MSTLSELVEYGIGMFDEIRLCRLLFILDQVDPVVVEMLARGLTTDENLKQTGIPIDELQRRLRKLIKLTEELDHRDNPKLNDGGPTYERASLAVVDIGDFLMAANDLADEIAKQQVARSQENPAWEALFSLIGESTLPAPFRGLGMVLTRVLNETIPFVAQDEYVEDPPGAIPITAEIPIPNELSLLPGHSWIDFTQPMTIALTRLSTERQLAYICVRTNMKHGTNCKPVVIGLADETGEIIANVQLEVNLPALTVRLDKRPVRVIIGAETGSANAK